MATVKIYAMPRRLYRFRSLRSSVVDGEHRLDPQAFDRELDTIERRYIYCPIFRQMNDPMEGLYRASERVQARSDYDRLVRTVLNQKLRLGIASLAEGWNNELMWAHYADGFRGICISYDVSRLLEGLPRKCALSRVAYGDRPYHLISASADRGNRAREILSTKSLRWAYEREWRLFAPEPGEAHYENDAVSSVYLGARMDPQDKQRVRARLLFAGVRVRDTLVDGYTVERTQREGGA